MRHMILAALLAATAPAAFAAPVPKEQLLVPPKDAVHYVVVSEAGKHGDMWRWTLPDGRVVYRHSQALRGWISETDQVVRLGSDGIPAAVEIRGITPQGDAAETLAIADGKATWKSTADSGTVGTTKVSARAGARSFTLRSSKLVRARYTVSVEARDARGNKAAIQSAKVRVTR